MITYTAKMGPITSVVIQFHKNLQIFHTKMTKYSFKIKAYLQLNKNSQINHQNCYKTKEYKQYHNMSFLLYKKNVQAQISVLYKNIEIAYSLINKYKLNM